MKHKLTILFLLFYIYCNSENIVHENILSIKFGGIWQQDQYLSPLLYSGMKTGISNEWWQPFRQETRLGKRDKLQNWKNVGKVDIQFGWMYSPTKSNRMYTIGIQSGWGAYYDWKFPSVGLQILLGPYLNLDFSPRTIASNINKPYSMDAAIQAEVMGGLSYSFSGKKTTYRLRYLVHTNLIGIDFMPDYWQSYYELSEGVSGLIRCAGIWNHRYIQQELTFDIQLPHSTWRMGIKHEYVEYGQKEMWFSREQVSAIIGTCFHYRLKPNKPLIEW